MCKIMRMLFSVVALMLFVSCDMPTVDVVDKPTAEHLFVGIIDDSDESRTYLDEQIRLLWNAGDYITLFEGLTLNKKYTFVGEDGDNAGYFEFVSQGFGAGNDLDRYYAIYPYSSSTKYKYGSPDYIQYTFPTTQNYVEGSVGLGANPMVAVTADLDDFDLRFRNVGSFLRVLLYGDNQTVGSIKLTTNSGEAITGTASIVPVYGGNPTCTMSGSGDTVTLHCGDGGVVIGDSEAEATVFWFVVPPITMQSGFTVTVSGYYGGEQSFEVGSTLTFTRNKYKSMTRELTLASSGAGMGVDGWGSGENVEGSI